MPTVEEISAWSLEETLAEIHELLPPQWKFKHWPPRVQGELFQGEVIDAGSTVQWSGGSADSRLLFLDVYGWLWTRAYKPKHPTWRRRRELTPQFVTMQRAGVVVGPQVRSRVPDPEDLDPKEVNEVYKKVKR